MVATVNPCGFAMLPAYIAYHLGLGDEQVNPLVRGARALALGLAATAGFVVLFGVVGLVISAGGMALTRVFPIWGFVVGAGLILLGLWLLFTRRHIGVMVAGRVMRPGGGRGVRDLFLFGIAYGIASLSCTLPVFLVVVGSALAAGGYLAGIAQFVSYGLGMGAVLVAVTLGVVYFRGVVGLGLRRLTPYVERIGALALVGAGSYLIYYWTKNLKWFY
ncbi:MAG: cytochrome c biogenesis protein CcdA [Chloroflexi bacterium]|nr:cytochrome c biogenesis protein CcdA [Chloroflexota bacterium]